MTVSTMGLATERRLPPRVIVPRYRGIRWLDRLVIRWLLRLEVEGLDRLPAAPFVLACNHHNGIDPLVVMAAAPVAPGITWFGPREDCSTGFARVLVRFLACFVPFTARRGSLRAATETVGRVIARGGVVGIFPEGRIAFRETALQRTNPGAAAFAIAHCVPVVPCAVIGTSALWRGRRVTVRFGSPLAPAAGDAAGATGQLQQRIERALLALLPTTESVLERAPSPWLTDILNGPDDVVRRRRVLGGWRDAVQWAPAAGAAA